MDNTFDVVVAIDDGEVGEAGFEKLVERKGAENFGGFDENHLGPWNHELADGAVIKAHNGGDTGAVCASNDGFGGALHNTDEILKGFGGVFNWLCDWLLWSELIELGVEPADEFTYYIFKHML